MKKAITAIVGGLALVGVVAAGAQEVAERKVKMAELPPAVQKAVNDYVGSHKATLRGLAAETENGKKLFEAEMKINGKTVDVTFDEAGGIFVAEEETAIDQIPAGARAAIEKAAIGGKVALVETITEAGKTAYEGHIVKNGKKSEVKVNAAGEVVK